MKCPDCGQYSLTYDFERNGWVCHVYNGFIPDESIGTALVTTLKQFTEWAIITTEEMRKFLYELGIGS